jgi:D-glycero-alpha-D-manno-heptose-7-phosphate kinase
MVSQLEKLAEAAGSCPPQTTPVRTGLVVTRTPLRISLAGGGTDFADFYRRDYGAVLSTAIDKYVYVTLKRHDDLFGAPIRLNYSETEQVGTITEIRNEIARACFQFLNAEPPLYMSTVADIPAASGLGSSSAFAVGLLHALHAYRGEHVSAAQLAEEAAQIETAILGRPIGKQDHYSAAFGGFNLFRFLPNGGVSVEAQRFPAGSRARLFAHLMMFWTGRTRDAGGVLGEQRANIGARMSELASIREQAHRMHAMLAEGLHPAQIGRMLAEGWQLKRRLASTISNSEIDAWHERAMNAGAWGGKLCGAGGGGFLLFVVSPEQQGQVRRALSGLLELKIDYEPQGSKVLMPHVE